MKAVILAGGKGTRLSSLTQNIPKALVKIGGKPIIERQILLLKEYGFSEIWILLGYLGDQIKNYLSDGKKLSVNIHYHQEDDPLGTAGALKAIEKEIRQLADRQPAEEDFLVLSCDIMMDFDINRFISWHNKKEGKIASMIIHPNDHPFDSDLVEIDGNGKIISLLRRPHPSERIYRNLSIASVFIFSPKIFEYIPIDKKCDIEKDILPIILESGNNIYGYDTPEYFKDMGTPDRLAKVEQDFLSGKIKRLNLRNKRKAIFLDRDGTINEEVDQLSSIKDFKIYDFAIDAIKKINDSDYLAIIITNQPMIAKGFMSEKELGDIHKKLETELGKRGAKIDAVYYCPHHPDKGFEGEIPELKIDCNCRKPKTGLIDKAVSDFNLDLSQSFFIGDSSCDAKTAENANINFIGVETGYACQDGKHQINQKIPLYKNLLEALKVVKII
jgi:mannose-1-phosphate guanylyltransferase / phosphomannomutase